MVTNHQHDQVFYHICHRKEQSKTLLSRRYNIKSKLKDSNHEGTPIELLDCTKFGNDPSRSNTLN